MLQTARAKLRGANGSTAVVTCVFDAGSQRSFIRKQLADDLGLKGPMETVRIATFGKHGGSLERVRKVTFSLAPVNDGAAVGQWMNALCLRQLCSPVEANLSLEKRWSHIHGLNLADQFPRGKSEIDVLVGLDFYYDFMENVVRRGKHNEPLAVRSTLGWILCGRVGEGPALGPMRALHVAVEDSVVAVLRNFWQLHAIGVLEEAESAESPSSGMSDFEKTVSFDGVRYCVKLPWKAEAEMPNNFGYALERLNQTEKRLQKRPKEAPLYIKAMREYIANGWVEEASNMAAAKGRVVPAASCRYKKRFIRPATSPNRSNNRRATTPELPTTTRAKKDYAQVHYG
uniref:DUF1758 domain-containing protein n=1 Tax=Trichuris muris TaxID=70415 RepID=A0A5S6Q835_TRIMR